MYSLGRGEGWKEEPPKDEIPLRDCVIGIVFYDTEILYYICFAFDCTPRQLTSETVAQK